MRTTECDTTTKRNALASRKGQKLKGPGSGSKPQSQKTLHKAIDAAVEMQRERQMTKRAVAPYQAKTRSIVGTATALSASAASNRASDNSIKYLDGGIGTSSSEGDEGGRVIYN